MKAQIWPLPSSLGLLTYQDGSDWLPFSGCVISMAEPPKMGPFFPTASLTPCPP